MSPRIRSAFAFCAAAAFAAGLAVLPAGAASADDAPGAEAHEAAAPTAENVRRFLDERVPEILAEHQVPGAAVAVVADGEQVHAGGYGEADVAEGTPVDPEGTSFPMASVSKSFTATAVLQLVDEGRLDLHADVNEYLPEDARVPDTYPGEPITLHHLLTHTAGFEDSIEGMAAPSREGLLPLADYASRYQPARVYPPGRFIAYSNYGTTLAGLAVQEVSGTPFNDYLARNVFEPLGMSRSGFAAPDEAAQAFTTPTLYADSPETTAAPMYVNQGPAGEGWATAADMSRFMLALLNGGELDGERVLSAESTEAMLAHQADLHPELTGAGYGTWDRFWNGPRVVGHSGDLDGAHSEYALVPELDLGVYAVVNGDGLAENPLKDARARIIDAVLTEFAGTTGAPEPAAAAEVDLDRYAGTYTTTRTSTSEPSAAMVVMDQMSVSVTGDGRLRTVNAIFGEQTWTPVGDGVFRSAEGEQLAFAEDGGEVIGLGLDAIPSQDYERRAWYEAPTPHFAAAGAALVVMLTVLAWPVTALVRRLRGRTRPTTAAARAASAAAGLAVLVVVAFAGYLVYLLSSNYAFTWAMFTGSPMLTVPLAVAAVVTVPVLVGVAAAWIRRWWTVAGRIHFTLVAASLTVFLNVAATYGLVWTPPV
ncbi:beta-lactamase family protein [Streptomonospora sp. S1-112]|uniref:Beta-lactamase family protein n=1 Tax=Streptomonospora mangrovi TaxID=2883123 RepID=A0A9X3NL58_9ACTN|nr:serine hydrolase domain-containing protein [Streptomonospora mangrovi]MDA0565759.1 beta-lactamase family protein [Streptomonospora mangrovi]